MSNGRENWIWMPHAGHFILGNECRFHLATYVGGYVVSTVGEYVPDSEVREIYARCRGIQLEGKGDARLRDWLRKNGFEEIGLGRKYETMVFEAEKSQHRCCPFEMVSGTEVDADGYNDPGDAYEGHLRMCDKWGGIVLEDSAEGHAPEAG